MGAPMHMGNIRPGNPDDRARIIRNLHTWCAEIRQWLTDIEAWNRRAHPNETPIDLEEVDPGGGLRQMLAECEEMLAKDPGHGPLAPFTYRIAKSSETPQ